MLKACRDLPKNDYGNVHDDEIAQATALEQGDVQDAWVASEGMNLSRSYCPTTTMPRRSRRTASLS